MSVKRTATSALDEIVAQADRLYGFGTQTLASTPHEMDVLVTKLGERIESFVIEYAHEGESVLSIMKAHSEDGRSMVNGANSTLVLLEYLDLVLKSSVKSGDVRKSEQRARNLLDRRIKNSVTRRRWEYGTGKKRLN